MSPLPNRLLARSAIGLALCFAFMSVSGCPAGAETTCPECIIHSASYTIGPNPPNTSITKVTMTSNGVFSGHCPGDDRPSCSLNERKEVGATSPGPRRDRLPWASDAGDMITVTIEVERVASHGAPTPEVERPAVTIEE